MEPPVLCAQKATASGCDSLTFSVTAGVTYYLVIEEYSAWDGYTLDIDC